MGSMLGCCFIFLFFSRSCILFAILRHPSSSSPHHICTSEFKLNRHFDSTLYSFVTQPPYPVSLSSPVARTQQRQYSIVQVEGLTVLVCRYAAS
ncbi:hypothetical protein BKA57DRAFT_446739 [Linnemannia elongata]|nr:hypothetical protein BKA57DRAFT_446739 [Linnemannia elongata]